MKYQTNTQKIGEFIEKNILPILKKKDLNYNEVIKVISGELTLSKQSVIGVVSSFIERGLIKEEHFLTIPDAELSEFLKEIRETEKETNDLLNEKGVNEKKSE